MLGVVLVCILAALAQVGYEHLNQRGREALWGVCFMALGALALKAGAAYRKNPGFYAVPATALNKRRVLAFGYGSLLVGPFFIFGGALCVFAAITGLFQPK
jgi:hypothetical protein